MPTEVIENLIHSKSGDYLDCTFGVGGHSKKILENLNNDEFSLTFIQNPENDAKN